MFGHSTLPPMQTVHATTVAIDGDGILIRGPSGSGKSDLALRLIDQGAELVADDRTELSLSSGRVIARSPDSIVGRLEVRGVGIVRLPCRDAVPVALVIDLVERGGCERMPDPRRACLLGAEIPCFRLEPHEPSATAKVRVVLKSLPEGPEA